jgi:hypothetical protein
MSRPGYAHGFMRIRQQAVVACAAVAAIALLLPSVANAACQTLPGRSGIEEYCETIPGATGNRTPFERPSHSRLSQRTASELARAGTTGKQVLGLARTGPSQASGKSGRAATGAGGGPTNGAVDTANTGVTNGSSVGSGLIWALVAAAVLVSGLALLRRRLRRGG